MENNFLKQNNMAAPIIPTPSEAMRLLNLIQAYQAATVRQMQKEKGQIPLVFMYTQAQCALLAFLETMANEGLTTTEKIAVICNFRVADFLLAQIELQNMMEVQ